MLDLNIDNYNRDDNDDVEIDNLVEIARENGIQADEETLYKFIKMTYNIGADMYALDVVAPSYNIVDEINFRLGALADEDGLDDDQFEQLNNYLEENVNNVRATDHNVRFSKDIIFDAMIDYNNYRNEGNSLEVVISEQMYYDFCKENGIG